MEAPNGAFGTFRRSGNGTPCTKTAATAPLWQGQIDVSFVAGPTESLYAYVYETYHCITALITITYLYCPKGLQNVMKSTLSVRPQVELQPAGNHRVFLEDNLHNPPPLARFFNCLLAGFGDSHINMAPTTNTRSLNSQISWGPKVVQDPK